MMNAEDGYYRSPSIAGDTVAFVSEDDVWLVDRRGGIARRLTAGWGAAVRPWLSPDGRYLAYTGKEEGDTEIYIMPGEGGEVRRLTYWGANSVVAGYSPQGHVVVASNYGTPFRPWFNLYTIDPEGGEPQKLPYGPAQSIGFGGSGGVVLGRYTADPALWKRYRGGTAGQLWIDADGSGRFTQYDGVRGNFTSPMWIGQRIYFLSDHEGYGNLYSMTPTGTDLRRHTDHDTYYARNAKTDGTRIVYHAGATLYVFDPALGENTHIAVDYRSQRTQREPIYPRAEQYVTEATANGDGSRIAITARGKLFQMGPWHGPVYTVGATDGVRYRLSRWLPDDSGMVTISDDGGEEVLEVHCIDSTEPPVRFVGHDLGHVETMEISPDGQFAALTNERMELWLADLKALTTKLVDTSLQARITSLDWSPDSRWIAYDFPHTEHTSSIRLYSLSENRHLDATRPQFADGHPFFDPKGRYLYFLSYRTFDPIPDTLRFDYNFTKGGKPYLIPLQADRTSPFLLESSPLIESKSPNPDEADNGPLVTKIDTDGIEDRVLAFPVEEGQYRQLGASATHVFWTTVEPEGRLSRTGMGQSEEARATLHGFDWKTRKTETIADKVYGFHLNDDRTLMVIAQRRKLRVLKAGQKVDPKEVKPGKDSGLVDLDRIVLRVDRGAEWNQMLREAWRLMRNNFWTQNMSGTDWNAIYDRYLALLPRVATRGELSDLMWEMQGELGTSHAYEMGGDYRSEPKHQVGSLAADFRWDEESHGYRITHIVKGDSFEDQSHSPLQSPGINVVVGDVIVAVNGHPVSREIPPQLWLVDTAGEEVALTILASGDPHLKTRTVVVKPLDQEQIARYREWVAENRAWVHQATDNRVGYVHIPDMGARGFSEFYRAYLSEVHHEALIVDIRFNGGGHVSPLILQTLGRKRIAYDIPRHGRPYPYPSESVLGPIVALTNQNAGSDGDIFSKAFQLMKLGPLLGTRTWGGVIGIDVRYALVDGSMTSQPEYSYWFQDVGWGVENYGVDPDIVVENTPQDYAAGHDVQLERTIEEVLQLLERDPARLPEFGTRPHLAPGKLPPRS